MDNTLLPTFIFLSTLVLFAQCKNQNSAEDTPIIYETKYKDHDIIGEWHNISMTVSFPGDSIFVVPEGKWEEILEIKPIVTQYTADKKFTSRYYNLEDSLIGTSEGTWRLQRDTLYLEIDGQSTAYTFSKEGSIGFFKGYLDWDQDGKAEELYEGKQVKGLKMPLN